MAASDLIPPQQNPLMMPGLMPPGPPPPPSPSLGFSLWAQDPQNAMKVMPSMTAPDKPLQPNAGGQMAATNPPPTAMQLALTPPGGFKQAVQQTQANVNAQPSPEVSTPFPAPSGPMAPPPMASAAPPRVQNQTQTDQAELQRLQQNGAGVNQVKNPFLRTLGKVADVAGTILAPGVAAAIPGTTVHNWQLQNQQMGRVAQDQQAQQFANQQLQSQAQIEDTQSQTAQRNALANKADSQADSYAPVTLTAEQASGIGHPELAGETMPSKTYAAMLTGKQKTDSAESIAGGKNQTAKQIGDARNARITSLAAEANKTKVLLQGMKDSTSSANTSARIAAKGATGAGGGKVPADVTKRAALAQNTIENADAVQGLITKRPEIVGAVGGRYTNVQQLVGSDDPDIQELGVRMHNIALASNGAHGLRSAEAVAQTEKELFNNFKTGPQGIAGGLKGLTSSVQTFLDDEKNFQQSGNRTGGAINPMTPPQQAPIQALTDGGVTYHIPSNMVAAFKKDHPNAR